MLAHAIDFSDIFPLAEVFCDLLLYSNCDELPHSRTSSIRLQKVIIGYFDQREYQTQLPKHQTDKAKIAMMPITPASSTETIPVLFDTGLIEWHRLLQLVCHWTARLTLQMSLKRQRHADWAKAE
ncbi:MAG TPA: hypothetical protein PKA70_23405 [Saprospiraceae bacterium]|nr:hypothetical protein [Saprospiraceae bacterium]